MRILPRNALVANLWAEGMILYYLHYAEGARPDLTLDSWYSGHEVRLARWQATHASRERPIVLTQRPAILLPGPVRADSIPVTPGQWLYVLRGPVRLTRPRPAPAVDPGVR
jgi:hypothetical protein